MNQSAFNFEEFIDKPEENIELPKQAEEKEPTTSVIDVQKAVVESLANDKIEQTEKIEELEREIADLKSQLNAAERKLEGVNEKLAIQNDALGKVAETLSINTLNESANQIALIDRSVELADHFQGETRDHVLEAIKDARDQAERDGRNRCAQVLEAVLVANEPLGNLKKHRQELKKIFDDNQNIINGPVIEELQKRGIAYKNGEEYLLAAEIIKRNY